MPVLLQFLGSECCRLRLLAALKVFGQLASALYITMDGKRFQEMWFPTYMLQPSRFQLPWVEICSQVILSLGGSPIQRKQLLSSYCLVAGLTEALQALISGRVRRRRIRHISWLLP